MSCVACNKLTENDAGFCNECYTFNYCSHCQYHTDVVGPLRASRGEHCCEYCLNKDDMLKEYVEIENIRTIVKNPPYLTDLINGWWSYGSTYYFANQNQIYEARDIPMDISDFKRAVLFEDAKMCGFIRGTTVIWN